VRCPRMFRGLFLSVLLALIAGEAAAAASAVSLTPSKVTVLANTTQVFSVRFLNASGHPAVGETVQFSNDACGFFPGGSFGGTVVTGADGVASIGFTAMSIGVTWCYVLAAAGAAQAYFDVWVYRASDVYLQVAVNPPQPRPGQSFTVTPRAKIGVYDLYNVEVSARVIPGTASAGISPATSDNGGSFTVTPDGRLGDYQIEVQGGGATRRITMTMPANPWQDLWWSGMAENGWGLSIVQHGDMLFGVVYAYDAAGKPIWYVIPGGHWNAAHTAFTGAVYIPHGSPFSAYDVARFDIGPALGSVTFTIVDARNATLDYVIDGIAGRKLIARNEFGRQETAPLPNVGDLWWGGIAQNGWGITVLQQYNSLFTIWFTYDDAGAPTWIVMPGGSWTDAATYEGHLYRSSGSPWLGQPYDAGAFRIADIGSYRLHFSGDTATFNYWMSDGRLGTLPLTRLPF